MNQSKVLKVITAASLAAALSVAFTACGDESSSTSPDPTVQGDDSSSSTEEHLSSSEGGVENSSSSEKDKSSSSDAGSSAGQPESSASTEQPYKAKAFSAECKHNKTPDMANLKPMPETDAITDVASATRTIGEDGFETIIIDEVYETCGAVFDTPDISESGDTLYVYSKINYPYEEIADCLCPTRITFKIEDTPRFSKAKTLVFNNRDIFSLETISGSTLTVSSVSGVCLNNEFYDPETDGVAPPVAYKNVDSDSATFVLERVKSSCEFLKGFASTIERPITSGLEITVSGDTLFVKPEINQSASQIDKDCICPSRISFKVKADSSVANAKIIVVDDDMNRGNRLRVIQAEEETKPGTLDPLEQYGLSRGTCMDKDIPEARSVNGLPEADLTIYENGIAILDLNFVEDYCEITAKVSQKVANDTLFLDYYDITNTSNCLCTFNSHRFKLDLKNTGASYVKFKDVVYYLVPVTYTKIPNWEI